MPKQPVANGPATTSHTSFEDAYALCIGCILIAVGLAMLRAAHLVTGGTAGLALLISRFVSVSPGVLFAILNLPFFILAARVMGSWFTARTILVSLGIAGMSVVIDATTRIASGNPAVAAVAGGTLLGMGTLALARHGAGVGGVGVVTLWLQNARGWNAGRTQIAIDALVLAAAGIYLRPDRLLWSAVSALMMASVVYLWHRPGRYTGVSPTRRRARR
ncbi:YitT family protein [Sphingomonas sp. IC4-52]|uniref:YitT family protein n=1 Tax=Sphingomonas sp. IC4-52 TaxID=2887202 RepID=UPI001D0F602B|nr:YitT family protein [Sphingomonas sp. IC4-52]MCC2979462.1 YitT family protein [Sphingomonas sp. IC4-52]